MKKILVLAIFALFACSNVRAVEEDDDVLVFTDKNFDDQIAKHEHILVEFYAPWCGHCKKLAPEYAAAAKELKKLQDPIYLAKVDATTQKKLADKFEVKSFPTLKWITNKGSKTNQYGGGRTKDEIVNWIKRKTGPASTLLSSIEELRKFREDNKVAVVFLGKQSDKEFPEFLEAASEMEKIKFAHFDCNAQCKEEFKTEDAKAILFKKFDNLQDNFSGEFTARKLLKFIEQNSVPNVFQFDDSYIQNVFGKNKTTLFLFADSNSQAYPQYFEMMKQIQKKDNSILYSVSDVKANIQQKLAEFVGVKEEDLPLGLILQFQMGEKKGSGMKKYKTKGQITLQSLQQFVEDFQAKKLEPFVKSQEIPGNEYDDGVKVLVGKNFEKQVFQSGKDYFVKFYAPWCGHCKALAPLWAELGKQINVDGSKLVIAKVDATQNEIESANVQGFPTLHFYKAGNKQPKVYKGERERQELVEFLKENSTLPEKKETDL